MAVPLVILAWVSETNKNNAAMLMLSQLPNKAVLRDFKSVSHRPGVNIQGMPFRAGPMFLHTPHSGVRLIAKVYRILRPKCDLRREKQGQRYSRASLFQAEARKSLFDLVFEVDNRSLASKT